MFGDSMQSFSEISDRGRLPPSPKVSVVVITYNHEDCLAQAIDSIAIQRTSFPFEIIIAEDCSTDGTRAVAEALQRRHPHLVRLAFTEANKGMNRNLRFALGLARAPYIAFCEGDDFWLDDLKLDRQVKMLEEAPGVDLAITHGVLAHVDGSQVEKAEWNYGPAQRTVPARELFARYTWVTPTASMVWRAKVTRHLPDWLDDAPFADMPLMIAGSARGGAVYDPRPTAAYRRAHPASFTVRLRDSLSQERADYARRAKAVLVRACEHYGMPRAYLQHRLDDFQLQIVRELAKAGRWLSAGRALLKISPSFLLHGVGRRIRRLAKRRGTSP